MLIPGDLNSLATVCGPCLTIYQPLREEHSQVAKPRTRIMAAIQSADRLLAEKAFDASGRDEMLQPLLKIAASPEWRARSGSLAMFRTPGFSMVKFCPEILPPRICFGDEFFVLPVLPALLDNRDFWLLSLSIKAVRLFRGSRTGLTPVPLPKHVPKSLAEASEFEQPDHTPKSRPATGSSIATMRAVPLGTFTVRETTVEYLHDYFRAVDRGIHALLAEDPQPLILAGITREQAIYRTANTCPQLLTGAIHGSPEALGPDALFARASELMMAYSAQAANTVSRQMEEASGQGLLLRGAADVIEAAARGEIEELILTPGAPGFEQHQESVNWSVLATLRNSGHVHVLPGKQPGHGVAAILRLREKQRNAAN